MAARLVSRGSDDESRQQAGTQSQQDVADLADAVKGQQALGLLLLEGLHRADEQRDGAQHRDDHPPCGQRIIRLASAGTSQRKYRIRP